jgi:hypothetical protein
MRADSTSGVHRARADGVVRDGYRQDVTYLRQVEGPGRLVKVYARLLGSLEVIGCDQMTAWTTLKRIAVDTVPALRTKVIRELVARTSAARASDIAQAAQTSSKTAIRHLEDLMMLGLAIGGSNKAPAIRPTCGWRRTGCGSFGLSKSETGSVPGGSRY